MFARPFLTIGFKKLGSALRREKRQRPAREELRVVDQPLANLLNARPALGESLSGHDAGWLGERVDEVLGKQGAVAVGSTEQGPQ